MLGLFLVFLNASPALAVEVYSASMFYSITYVMTTLGTFGMILLLSWVAILRKRKIADLKGLNKRSKWFAFIMLLLIFSLAGIPPLMGFGEIGGCEFAVAAGQAWLAVTAVLFSLIGAFYYLRIVKVMYFDEPQDESITASFDMKLVLSVNGLAVLFLGMMPFLLGSCVEAIEVLWRPKFWIPTRLYIGECQ